MKKHIQSKSKKVVPMAQAVRQFIHNRSHISIGGFTVNRQPMACIHEIIRQELTGLHIYMHSGGQAFDLLVGAGCVKAVELAYGANGRFAPTCIRFQKAVENGELLVEDYSNYQMTLRFKAGAMGIPFLPVRSGMGTDILNKWGFDVNMRRKDLRLANKKMVTVDNPFKPDHPEPVVLVPAINPDVTVIHAQQVDTQGTVRMAGLTFADVEQARSSRHVIVTCEEVVEPANLRKEPERNHLPFFMVDAVVKVPYGAHPTACYGYYDYDASHLNTYKKMASDDKQFRIYLDKYITGVNTHTEYLKKVGEKSLERIRAVPPYGYTPGLVRG